MQTGLWADSPVEYVIPSMKVSLKLALSSSGKRVPGVFRRNTEEQSAESEARSILNWWQCQGEAEWQHKKTPAIARIGLAALCLTLLAGAGLPSARAESVCFGSVSNGRLEGGVKLPTHGPNFVTFSTLAAGMGRTFVHSKVAAAITDSYATLNKLRPDTRYVYGETGWSAGGRFKPHRTHQNGLSVDFFVPVTDAQGRSVPIPTNATDRFGYDIEFDSSARYEEYRIDFAALSAHLRQLHIAARAHGIGITQVIFDPPMLPKLLATADGAYLRKHLRFMQRPAWVRHDEHYHVDFAVRCNPR